MSVNVTQKSRPPETIPMPATPPARNSVSRQMFERFERRKTWRRCLSALYIVSFAAYLSWSFTIIDPQSLFLSVLFYVTECLGFVLGLIGVVTTWDYNHRDPLPCPENLSVDVFVTTYKEPLHIIRRTAMAAKAIEYPHETWVLDDGRRAEVRAMAEELGLRYLSRPDNKNAKAGNLNFGLGHSSADFVMSLDADHIALPHALNIMLGFFADEKVALVQTPQDYYNTDAFQYMNSGLTKGLWHDQSSYYNIIEPCGDKINAATCIGTGVVYRRSAIDSIGGIPTDSITEDIHTSLKLQKKGYQIAYLNEPIAYGLAEESLSEFYKVRHRWAHGNIHAVEVENIRFCGGLTWRQRFQYMALELVYLEGWQQLLLFIIPVVALVTGEQPFRLTIFNMLIVLFYPVYITLLSLEAGCGFTRFWAGQVLAMTRWPIHIVACAALFRTKLKFRSSTKNTGKRVNWGLMMPQLTVTVASLAAVVFGVFKLSLNFKTGALSMIVTSYFSAGHFPNVDVHAELPKHYTMDLVAISGFWALYTVARGCAFLRKVVGDARNNHEFCRFRIPLPLILDSKSGYGCVSSISEDWVRFIDCREGPHAVSSGTINATIVMPAGPLPVRVAVERVDGRTVEGKLVFESEKQRDMLANGLYSVDWHREFMPRTAYFLTPSDLILKWLGHPDPQERPTGAWRAVLCQRDGQGASAVYGIMAKHKKDPTTASLLTFKVLATGEEILGTVFSDGRTESLRCRVTGIEPLSSLVEKGLDGAIPARYTVKVVA